ncbi:MAG: rane protein [Flavipsychrobacter sp.]|jgi:uncharacterized membrane protein|nr:rane protein [Flavipsychrobacter sp.]
MNYSTELDIKRIQSLTDSIFAVAMAILILSVKIPVAFTGAGLRNYFLHHTLSELFIYFVGFTTLGIFWIGSHFQHHLIAQTDQLSTWLTIFFLMLVCIIPFSAGFLNHYRHEAFSVIFYCINLIVANLCHYCLLIYGWKKKYVKPNLTHVHYKEAKQRILIPVYIYLGIAGISFLSPRVAVWLLLIPVMLYILPGKTNGRLNAGVSHH